MNRCAALTILLFAASCTRQPDRPLVVAISEDHASAAQPGELATLEQYLSEQAKIPVKVRVAPSGHDAIELFGRGEADIGILKLFEFLLARIEYGVSPRRQILRENKSKSYRGEIVVLNNSELETLADLNGKRIAYVDPYSTSGFLFPAKILADAKIQVTHAFAGSHDAAMALLREGKVSAAATHSTTSTQSRDTRVLAETAEIPNEPVFVREGANQADCERVLAALTSFAATEDGKNILPQIASIRGFAPVEEDAYDGVLKTIEGTGKAVFDLVPDGWRVRNSNRVHFIP